MRGENALGELNRYLKKTCRKNNGNLLSNALLAIIIFALIAFAGYKSHIYIHNKGVNYYNQQNYEHARRTLKTVLRINPKSKETRYVLANTYIKMDKFEEAEEELNKIIEIDPKHTKAYIRLSEIYLEKGEYEKTIRVLEKALKFDPDNQELKDQKKFVFIEYMAECLNEGIETYLAGDRETGLMLIKKAIEIMPNYAYSHYTLGLFYFLENKHSNAENELLKTIEINPKFIPAYKLIGDIHFNRQEFENGIQRYKEALRLNPENATVNNDMGLALVQLERYKEALPYMKEAARLAPDNINIRYNLASTHRDNGEFNEAISEYKKVLYTQHDYPNVHNDLGDIYFSINNIKTAQEEYLKEIVISETALKKDPNDLTALNNLAYAYAGMEEYVKARDIIDRTIMLAPDFRRAYLTLAKIHEKTHNPVEAFKALNKARGLSRETNFIDREINRIKENIRKPQRLQKGGEDPAQTFPLATVYLKNGKILNGYVISETDEEIVFKLADNYYNDLWIPHEERECKFKRSEIIDIYEAGNEAEPDNNKN